MLTVRVIGLYFVVLYGADSGQRGRGSSADLFDWILVPSLSVRVVGARRGSFALVYLLLCWFPLSSGAFSVVFSSEYGCQYYVAHSRWGDDYGGRAV